MIWLLIISILSIRERFYSIFIVKHVMLSIRKAMDVLVKQLEHHPRTLKRWIFGIKLVYQHQMWLDGLYMASPFLAQYGAEFNRPDLIDEAVKQFRLCHEYTYDARTGLYYHAWDESKSQRWANPETGHSPNFWGRSIGWWFMALVDALDYIPENHPGRADMMGWIQGLAENASKVSGQEWLVGIRLLISPNGKAIFQKLL